MLLRVREVGICGTDREIAAFEYGAPPPGEDHLVIGHEALGMLLHRTGIKEVVRLAWN
ncbi:alcohol dehydrogenase catalytic domain-containing protein [Corallococcus soli]|uniref:alcohol dehydrogenase catalytic domain-containing protein n=1 Tax=Corallococcus soli TaxID=2710757 RepID=UPI0034E22AFD